MRTIDLDAPVPGTSLAFGGDSGIPLTSLPHFAGVSVRVGVKNGSLEVEVEPRSGTAKASSDRNHTIVSVGGDTLSLTLLGEERIRAVAKRGGVVTVTHASFGEDPSRPRLQDVTLELKPGQAVGIIGPSGAGKSTLLAGLAGRIRLLRGRVDWAPTSQVGWVPQSNDALLAELSAEQNLASAAALRMGHVASSAATRSRVTEVLALVGLSNVARTPMRDLSGGQQRRLAVGLELLARPSVLLLDEPFAGLSSSDVSTLWTVLLELRRADVALLFSVHQPSRTLVEALDGLVLVAGGRARQVRGLGDAGQAVCEPGLSTVEGVVEALERRGLEASEERGRDEPAFRAPVEPSAAGTGVATWTYLSRTLRAALGRRSELLLGLAVPVLVGSLAGLAFVNAGTIEVPSDHVFRVVANGPGLLFVLVLAAIWLATQAAAKEIPAEWPVLRREREVGVPRAAYFVGKVLALGLLTSVHTGLLTMAALGTGWLALRLGEAGYVFGSLASQIDPLEASLRVWGVLVLSGLCGTSIGLMLSSAFRDRAGAAVVSVPLALVACTLFSGLVPPERWMPPPAVALSLMNPARHGFQAALAIELVTDARVMRDRCGISDGRIVERTPGVSDVMDSVCSAYLSRGVVGHPGYDAFVQRRWFREALDPVQAVGRLVMVLGIFLLVSSLVFCFRVR